MAYPPNIMPSIMLCGSPSRMLLSINAPGSQVYVKNLDSKNAIPNPALGGFQRIFIKAGERRKVMVPVWEKAFTVVNENGERVEDGRKYEIFAGCSQPDERSIELTGTEPVKIIWEKED